VRDERGFALVAVLLVLGLLGIVGAEFAFSMRLEASAVRAYKENVIGTHLAEAAVAQAMREIAGQVSYVGVDDEDALTFYAADRRPLPRFQREKAPLGAGHFTYAISDEEARLNLNTVPPDRIDRLLQCRGMDKSDRDPVVASIQDWRDSNDEHRLNGAESDDTYLKLPVPYRARNGNFDAVAELLQVKGITPELYDGKEDEPGLAEDVTVKTPGPVNINTAGRRVLCALGLSDAEMNAIEQTRRGTPYQSVPGQFGGRGFVVTSRTFRIQAQGLVDDRVVARITAIVQKRQGATGGAILAVLEWSASR
jgi:general secretion pathway protein K